MKYLKSFAAVLLGLIISFTIFYTSPKVSASGNCFYAYCQGGNCYANQNATNCMGIGGELPCTSSKPCSPPDQ